MGVLGLNKTGPFETVDPREVGLPCLLNTENACNLSGAVDRAILGKHVLGPSCKENLQRLEAAVHPLVADARQAFLEKVRRV
jgi:hypothetical protein